MNTESDHPAPKSAAQEEFLRVFLANEREIFRYVAALVPPTADAQEIVQQTAVVLWEKFDRYDSSRPFAPWACRFALNVARKWMARRQRWKALLDGGLAEELALRREQLRPEFDARLVHLANCLQKSQRNCNVIGNLGQPISAGFSLRLHLFQLGDDRRQKLNDN